MTRMPLIRWGPPSSELPTTAASSLAPIPAPAPGFMWRIEHWIRSLSSPIMSTCAALDLIQLGQPATVKVAANLVKWLSYNNKDILQTGLIVGGWDKYEGGKIHAVPLGGTILELPFAIGGTGSTYLYGFFDQAWKEGMTREEAELQFIKQIVTFAVVSNFYQIKLVRCDKKVFLW